MAKKLNVLIVDDDPQLIRILQAVLKPVEAEIRIAGTGRLALQMILDAPPSIMLLDMKLPDISGMEILKDVSSRGFPVTVIVMTAHGSVDLAVDAMREGAYDFLTKPLDFERVRIMVRNAVERHRIIAELDDYKNQYERTRLRGLMGSSPAMQRLYRQIRSVGMGASPALLAGEKGTEVAAAARAIHDDSPRSTRPFIAVKGAALQPSGLATAIREAASGSVYIESIEGLPPDTAAALKSFLRGEGIEGEPLDARILASTAADPAAGMLDRDLTLMLEVSRVELPPLRERGEDVLDLADHLISALSKEVGRSFSGLDDEAQVAFVNYGWPENRDELDATLRAAIQRYEGRLVTLEMLPKAVAAAGTKAKGDGAAPLRGLAASGSIRPLWQIEREEIEKALKVCDGNVLHAARLLEISPATIYRKQQVWKTMKS
ncbi:response regulator [bacterium]|nr:response regulator [bacterium]